MKKLVWMVLVLTLFLCGCSRENPGNTQSSVKTAVSKGYSLSELDLSFAGEKDNLSQQNQKYSSAVNVNGNYTEIYANTSGGRVSVMKLQGFRREDLKNAGVYINHKVYSANQLKGNLVYQNKDVVVFDLSQMVYQDSLGARIQSLGLEADKETSLIQAYSGYTKNIGSMIRENTSKQDQPETRQNQPETAKGIIL